jgi:hypothetical protein
MTIITIPTTTRPISLTDEPPARRVTARQLLASIEAIPETSENYRQLREAVRDAKTLIEQDNTK